MNFKFATPLLLSSALAMGALSFVACGGDDTGISAVPGVSSSSAPEQLPEVTPTTSIDTAGLGILYKSISKVQFKGSISIVLDDPESTDDPTIARFANVQFDVRSASGASAGSVIVKSPVDYVNNIVTEVNLGEMGVETNLDEGYSECGAFFLFITASRPDGTGLQAAIPFERPTSKCVVEVSSSSEAHIAAPLDSVRVKLNTKTANCVVLSSNPPTTTTDATAGDICLNRAGTVIGLSSGTGYKFAQFANTYPNDWAKDFLPNDPVTTDDFTYNESALSATYPDFLSVEDIFFVAVNPAIYAANSGSAMGFAAFIPFEGTKDANGDRDIELLIYKAK